MQKPERSTYTPLDFLSWRETQSLELTPKFQRRGVWNSPARSFFIDTLLRGMPVPPLYLRVAQSLDGKRIVREVVDGQQRIAAVLDYVDGKYSLSRALDSPHAGSPFAKLSKREQDAIKQYSLICETLHGASDKEVLEIFTRLNTYSVPLNSQELRNGTFFGFFKNSAYQLAHEHLEFWRKHGIFSERGIARMLEVELTSELIVAELDGLQDKKTSINNFYEKYDKKFTKREWVENRFRTTLDQIEVAVGDSLRSSEFRRPPLFYSLFCVVYLRVFGLPRLQFPTPRKKLSAAECQNLNTAIIQLSEMITTERAEQPVPESYAKFVLACLRHTDNIQPRLTRLRVLYKKAF